MNPIEFISKRFEMPTPIELHIGDEVITKDYKERGIVIREIYYLGHGREPFTTIFRGQTMSTERVKDLEKTGRHFEEMNMILDALHGAKIKSGADMRNPNCVTCDHFGKCEKCEKGDEE